jgi:hypothetical protein
MSKLIKRKDGSYSKRGLWDNIRANKGSGKEPTKEMLKQESKIKKEGNMNSMYKKGGKTSKKKVMKEARKEGESFMEESKEIGFGAPGVKPPKRRFDLGGLMDKDKPKEQPTAPNPGISGNSKGLPLPKPSAPDAVSSRQSVVGPGNVMQNAGKGMSVGTIVPKKKGGMVETGMEVNARMNRAMGEATMAGKKKMMGGKYKKGGFPDLNKDGKVTQADILKGRGVDIKKKGGAKSMEPGGGGRFEAMVGKLKSKGKSEESAEAIAASVGRKKYGKSKFQAMAAAGKKKMMGGKKC